MTLLRFDGEILGVGTAAGVRVVVGAWAASPYGRVADAMVEHPDGRRVLVAPHEELAGFVASTYRFDEVRVEATAVVARGQLWSFESSSLAVSATIGRRSTVGRLLRLVPPWLARTRAWCRAIDPLARRLRPGVRTYGSAGGGRREYYCAHDEHVVSGVTATWCGTGLGTLADVDPPVRFGFGSAPRTPALVRVTTLVDTGA